MIRDILEEINHGTLTYIVAYKIAISCITILCWCRIGCLWLKNLFSTFLSIVFIELLNHFPGWSTYVLLNNGILAFKFVHDYTYNLLAVVSVTYNIKLLTQEEVAREFGIPVQFQRFWLWAKRQNHTYRPNRPLTPPEEAQSVSRYLQSFLSP